MKEIYKTKYGQWIYDEKIQTLTPEEIKKEDEKDELLNQDGIAEALKDGFMPFPVFFEKGSEMIESYFYVHETFEPSCTKGFYEKYGMRFNIYIPSYGRAGMYGTMEVLDEFNVKNYYIAIDGSQYQTYKEVYGPEKIIIRDPSFRTTEKLDMQTSIKSPISHHGTAGIYNSLLHFSKSLGETHYWTIDDDILGIALKAYKGDTRMPAGLKYNKDDFYRCSKIKEEYGFSYTKFMNSMEEVMIKMRNPGFMGIEKFGLTFINPVYWRTGTRVYSYYLTDNSIQMNHFGQHNNDVITSLEHSKYGHVNMLLEGLNYDSGDTQTGGGLTDTYKKFGTLDKGKVLIKTFPNVSKINYLFNRIHHVCNYQVYNKLRLVGKAKET